MTLIRVDASAIKLLFERNSTLSFEQSDSPFHTRSNYVMAGENNTVEIQ